MGLETSLEWWRRYGRLHTAHCAGERLARACNTRGDTGKDTRAERRPGQSKAEKSWGGNALFLGNSSELSEQRDIAGGREHFKVLENLCQGKKQYL